DDTEKRLSYSNIEKQCAAIRLVLAENRCSAHLCHLSKSGRFDAAIYRRALSCARNALAVADPYMWSSETGASEIRSVDDPARAPRIRTTGARRSAIDPNRDLRTAREVGPVWFFANGDAPGCAHSAESWESTRPTIQTCPAVGSPHSSRPVPWSVGPCASTLPGYAAHSSERRGVSTPLSIPPPVVGANPSAGCRAPYPP